MKEKIWEDLRRHKSILVDIRENSELKKLFIPMEDKSILVVEDIDINCSIELQNKVVEARAAAMNSIMDRNHFLKLNRYGLSLGGLLGYLDGLVSNYEELVLCWQTSIRNELDGSLLKRLEWCEAGA
ncbi:hypothetical protein Patl1_36471 [Pistacia atlantica]|nr:hypothetical protein Patl1_36471 [Pistacia atlantica]